MAGSFGEVMKSWEGKQVVIINPQSFSISKLGVKISLEHYEAVLASVTGDYVQFNFTYKKADDEQPVEQFIPLAWIKRASQWGEQRYIQL